jgi:hypothetical protein
MQYQPTIARAFREMERTENRAAVAENRTNGQQLTNCRKKRKFVCYVVKLGSLL